MTGRGKNTKSLRQACLKGRKVWRVVNEGQRKRDEVGKAHRGPSLQVDVTLVALGSDYRNKGV